MEFKKYILLFLILISSHFSYASNPTFIKVVINCPSTQDSLIKMINKIVGNGDEQIDTNAPVKVLFSGNVPANFSGPISSYNNNNVSYSSATGQVSCSYKKLNAPDFNVSYLILNGTGGTISLQSSNGLVLSIPCGLDKHAIS